MGTLRALDFTDRINWKCSKANIWIGETLELYKTFVATPCNVHFCHCSNLQVCKQSVYFCSTETSRTLTLKDTGMRSFVSHGDLFRVRVLDKWRNAYVLFRKNTIAESCHFFNTDFTPWFVEGSQLIVRILNAFLFPCILQCAFHQSVSSV